MGKKRLDFFKELLYPFFLNHQNIAALSSSSRSPELGLNKVAHRNESGFLYWVQSCLQVYNIIKIKNMPNLYYQVCHQLGYIIGITSIFKLPYNPASKHESAKTLLEIRHWSLLTQLLKLTSRRRGPTSKVQIEEMKSPPKMLISLMYLPTRTLYLCMYMYIIYVGML